MARKHHYKVIYIAMLEHHLPYMKISRQHSYKI